MILGRGNGSAGCCGINRGMECSKIQCIWSKQGKIRMCANRFLPESLMMRKSFLYMDLWHDTYRFLQFGPRLLLKIISQLCTTHRSSNTQAFAYVNPTSRRPGPPGQCLLLPRLSSNATSSQKPSLFWCPSWPGPFLLKQIWHNLTLAHLQLVLSARPWAPRRQGHSWILLSCLVFSTRSDTEEGWGRLEEWIAGRQWGTDSAPHGLSHPRHLPRWCIFTLSYRKPDALSSPRSQPFLPVSPFLSQDHQGSVNWNFWFPLSPLSFVCRQLLSYFVLTWSLFMQDTSLVSFSVYLSLLIRLHVI